MIHANRIVTVGEQESIIDRPIVLYRGDREVEIEFTLVGNEFTFSEEGNVIKSVNASHGQLVLNTPSGEHMFSELAECHEGKVVFVVTKEMIDEFIEMGFYSFQIRLYDSAEMKSRVTFPPVMNGFDIRNPIAAEDETNVVDQGIVDYARIFKDQSNEELSTFDWTGAYNKTEWVHHDVITENKLNKIEDALYSINANVKESDVVMLNTLDQVKKDADKYVKEHMAEVEADVDEFERNLNTDVQKFKVDTNAAMTAHKNEVSEELESVSSQLEHNANQITIIENSHYNIKNYGILGDGSDETDKIQEFFDSLPISDGLGGASTPIDYSRTTVEFPKGTYKFSQINIRKYGIKLIGSGVIDGTIKIGRDEQIFWLDFAIDGLTFHHKETKNSIVLKNVRRGEIKNCRFINSDKAICIENGDDNYSQSTHRINISNNNIVSSNYFLYSEPYSDINSYTIGDFTVTNNEVTSKISNITLNGVDGLICSNNTMFMSGFVKGQLDENKHENIKIYYCNFVNISNNSLFEAGKDAIKIERFQNVNINGNNIAWCGQSVRGCGISLTNKDNSATQLYNISNIHGNNIDRPSANGVYLDDVGYINVTSNQIISAGSKDFFNGSGGDAYYGIYVTDNTRHISVFSNHLSENAIRVEAGYNITNNYSNNVTNKGVDNGLRTVQPKNATKEISVKNNISNIVIAYSTYTKITHLNDGQNGQEVSLFFYHTGSGITNTGNIVLANNEESVTVPAQGWMVFKYIYGKFREVARSF